MRDIIWLVADNQCAATISGFLCRNQFHLSINCGKFKFNPSNEIIVHPQKDPGVWKTAHEMLRGAISTHAHAVIVLDNAWEGSPGSTEIISHITAEMYKVGWSTDRFTVIVIEPELEAWIWQDNPNVDHAFGHSGPPRLREKLESEGFWPSESPKPSDPKAAVETICGLYNIGPESAIFNEITSKVSVNKCIDPAFNLLKTTLQTWYPV